MASDPADQPVAVAVEVDGALADSNAEKQEERNAEVVAAAATEEGTGGAGDNSRTRVKVYELPEGASEWEAKGTGNVECVWV